MTEKFLSGYDTRGKRYGHGWEASVDVGVMWSLGRRPFIRRAAVCRWVAVSMHGNRRGKVAVVESRDDESLNKNASFVKATFHLQNSGEGEKACSGTGG